MNDTTRMVQDSADRLFREHCTKELVDAAEGGQFPAALWSQLEALGLPRAAAPEHCGGSGLPLADALGMLRLVGEHAVPLPLAESLIGHHLLGIGGCDAPPEGPLTLAVPTDGDSLSVRIQDGSARFSGAVAVVPFAPWASRILLVAPVDGGGTLIAPCAPDDLHLDSARNLAGEPVSAIHVDGLALPEASHFELPYGIDAILEQLALSRAVMIAGAMQSILDLSTTYALERKQFGRPIAGFQAIQQQLAVLAGEAAAAIRAADGALEVLGTAAPGDEVAVAKARAGEAAGRGAEIAHQVHGAMGFTYEHRLHHRTRRLWSWRDDYGHEAFWQARLGRRICTAGADALWAVLTHSN
jgi:acyl-CoA dehydrogenase